MKKHDTTHKTAAHYQKIVYWSGEDDCYIGQCPALFGGGVHGHDELNLHDAVRYHGGHGGAQRTRSCDRTAHSPFR